MAGASHISELLSSHSFAYTEKKKNALRCTATKEYEDLGGLLLKGQTRALESPEINNTLVVLNSFVCQTKQHRGYGH
jgi:hypothetical protein